MNDLVKIVFFFIAAVFVVSYLNTVDLSGLPGGEGSPSRDSSPSELSDRSTYNRSYDTNRDGVVSNEEYEQGELRRIADELELLERAVVEAVEEENRSIHYGLMTLSARGAYATDEDREYLTISVRGVNDQTPINVTGWRLASLVSERYITIGQGVALLDDNRPWRREQDIFIGSGERLIVSSGDAPGISTGFLTNSCMGYLDQDDFYPSLSSGSCPLLRDTNLSEHDLSFNDFRREREYDECMDAIESVNSCEIVRRPDSDLTSDCRAFIREYSNYEGCVELNKDAPDFYGREWRIFADASRDIWREEREAIVLLDREGKIVDLVRY